MIKQHINKVVLIVTGMLVMTTLAQAHPKPKPQPLWTYSAPSPSSVSVSAGGHATVTYTVTSHTNRSKSLVLQTNPPAPYPSTPGITASACSLPVKGSTCTLTITIDGSQVPAGGIHGGPYLCQADSNGTPNRNQCYQPSDSNLLNITKSTAPLQPTQYTNIYAQTNNYREVYSFNNGSSWNPMINQQSSWCWNIFWGRWAPHATTASMAIDAQGVVYQAVQGRIKGASGQVIYSQDGMTWQIMNVVFSGADTSDVSNVAAIYSNTLYVGTVNGYIMSTADLGGAWTQLNQGNVLDASGISTIITDASGTVYVGAGTGSVYYSTTPTQGSTWTQAANSPSPGNTITSLAITNTNGQSTWYASASDNNVYYSTNQGQTAWTQMTINWPAGDAGDYITVLSSSNNALYAGTNNGYVFTLTPSGTNTWDATQQSASIDGTAITVLTTTPGTLSPLFVEGTFGASTNPQALPVNGTAALTVTNYSQNTAINVQIQSLPTGVTQTPGADCAQVVSNGTCTITLSTTKPFAPQRVAITSSNISGPIEYVALVSSMNNYLVYNTNNQIAYVVDSADAANSPAVWSPTPNDLGISETSTTPCNGATDGYCDTGVILNHGYTNPYAAELCAAKNNNTNFPGGTFTPNWWYLPSTCELGAGLYGNSSSSTILSCNTAVPTGIFSLYGLGYLANLSTGVYWGSTEVSSDPQLDAWVQFFAPGGGGQQDGNIGFKGYQPGVRCVQGFTY